MELSISIVNYNTKDSIRKCLLSIYNNLKNLEYEIIVVDNASTDSSIHMIENEFPQVKLIKNNRNLFFTRANNQAVRKSKGRYILLLNSDTAFLDNSLKTLLDFMEKNPLAGAVSGKIICERTGTEEKGWQLRTPQEEIARLLGNQPNRGKGFQALIPSTLNYQLSTMNYQEVDVVSDCFILLRRKAFFQINLYDERFLLYYTEDDLCRRLKANGWKVFYLPEAKITHKLFESSKKLPTIKILFIGMIDGTRYYNKHYGLITGMVIGFFFIVDLIRRIILKLKTI